MPRLPPTPELEWSADETPRATAFDDVYFSRAGGLEESEAVFVRGCGLPEAWRDRKRFAICELGFGTGLNVLATWRVWKATRLPHAILHISSIEAFPLAKADAARALAQFPEISDLASQLLERWPVRTYAPQRLWFPEDGFALTLFTGEAESTLAGMSGQYDGWYLDGFAPARNATMWTPALFEHIARLSAPGARVATFTVAGDVRRGLEAAGFKVEKKPGHGAKRERLEALLGARAPAPVNASAGVRDADGPRGLYPYAAVASANRVAIIGAGIAGASCAQALMRRRVETIVLEGAPSLGAGASGNPAGIVMPRLDRGGGAAGKLFLAAYLYAVAAYEAMGRDVFTPCGVEERSDPRTSEALGNLLADPPLPADWFCALASGAALHPRAGLVRPLAVIEVMLRGAEVMCDAPVQTLEPAGAGWTLRAPDGRALLKADAVVLACGAALAQFESATFLPIELSRGQIEWGPGPAPPHVVTRGTYVAPLDGGVLFGATFDKTSETAVNEASRRQNLVALAKLAPQIASRLDPAKLHSRAALRATTPDRAPIAGLLPRAQAWRTQYAALAHGGRIETDVAPPAHDGVYVIGGLGARGLTLAPLLGERIASEICGEPLPLSQATLDAIHPARFLHRALKRR